MLTFGNKYSYLTVLLVGILLGVYFCSLFSGCGKQSRNLPALTVVKPDVLKKQVAAVQASFQAKIDSLGTTATHLKTDLATTQTALDKAKRKNIALQTQVYDLLDRSATVTVDTVHRIQDCDSLQSKVKELVINDNVKDSLYEEKTNNLQQQVDNKDSTLLVERQAFQHMQQSFTQSLQQQEVLQQDNKILRRSVRREKRAGVFRTIGLAIVAVLATHYLTK